MLEDEPGSTGRRIFRARPHLQTEDQGVIPEKADQAANRKKKGSRGGRPITHDTVLYRERNTVEHCINMVRD